MSNQNGNSIKKTALDEFKLRLAGPQKDGQRRPPMLGVKVIKNNPRLDVFTNDESDKKDYGRISAPMDGKTFFTFMAFLGKVIEAEPDTVYRIANKVGPPQKLNTISHTLVGKDKQGRVFISVTAQDRPRIPFYFTPSNWHDFTYLDGTPIEEAELSKMCAEGWRTQFTQLVANVQDSNWEEPEQYNGGNRGGNRGGGGGNRGGYNSGGGNEGGFDSGDAEFPM